MLWLGVHFPMLPLEVFTCADTAGAASRPRRQAAPAAESPTVVIDAAGRVMLRNSAAALTGITPGCALATAHSIAAELKHHRRDLQREQQRLELLGGALYGFSDQVSLIPPSADAPSSGMALEAAGSLKLFGDVSELARRVAGLCRDLGHEAQVRWASTPLAALTLAQAGASRLGRVPLRQAVIEPERLTADRIERLANMGVQTVGQLLALPRQGLARRFGQDLVDYLARLTGDRPDPRRTIQAPRTFRAPLHLLEPLNSKEALMFPMQRLLSDLQHWLVARQLGAEQLRWHFTASGPGRTATVTVRFSRAQQSRAAFLDITRLELAEAALPEDVVSVVLEARRLAPWSAGSRDLFRHQPGQSPAALEELGELVDQLQARLGRGACHGLQVRDQHTPEHAWRPAPPLGGTHGRRPAARARRNRTQQASAPAAEAAEDEPRPGARPLWLFDPPRPIERRRLTLLRGPERIHTGWWHAPGQARDYYVARHDSGAECWVYVDPSEQWFLHGYFA